MTFRSISKHSLQAIWLLALVFVSSKLVASDRAEAQQWLERMASAMNQMSYQGTFVYSHGDELETMFITHIADQQGVRERLYSLSGSKREIIRDANGIRCVIGDGQSIVTDPIVARPLFLELPLQELIGENSAYEFEMVGYARIAQQSAQQINIVPKDGYRYGYSLWLEAHSGLLLKWVLLDNRKKTLAKLLFTDIRLGAEVDPDELYSSTPEEEFVPQPSLIPAHQVLSHSKPGWQPSRLPNGFRMTSHSHPEQAGESTFEHMVYSDGLASVSVYVESVPETEDTESGLIRMGATHAFSRRLDDVLVTVIGEVPALTVTMIGKAVERVSNDG